LPEEQGVPGSGSSSYELVPYASMSFPESHPDQLATIATLFGMTPPDVARARVLEIGCGLGENIIPMAAGLPEGSFLGIDASERQVAEGRATIAAAGLKNVALTQMNLMDAGPDLGTFDYIVCHGVYSWVAPEVQQKLLAVLATRLAPGGVAYVGYNVYPRWHMQNIVRDAMFFHIGAEPDPREAIRKAREMLEFLVQFPAAPEDHYMAMLRAHHEELLRCDDSYLYHDYLADVNQPVYYHQFLERIAVEGLKPVADARFFMNACAAPEPIRAALDQVSDDPARREEYLDLLLGQNFRRTLLCHQEVALLGAPSAAAVEGLQAALYVAPGALSPEIPAGTAETFPARGDQAVTVTVDHPVLQAAVRVLGERYPRAVPWRTLWRATAARLSAAGFSVPDEGAPERGRLAGFLLEGYGSGWAELHCHLAFFIGEPGERPATTPLARHQARSGRWRYVTNLRHEAVDLSRFDRHLLALLDGRTRGALVDALEALVTDGTLAIRGSGPGPLDAAARRAIVAESLRQGLARLAAGALLVA
jgi:SAM-dependent methyltransferase